MTFIPDEELKEHGGLTLAPMIDFLFLMLAVFASLAVSRVVMHDTDIELVESKTQSSSSSKRDYKVINVTVAEDGSYKWSTEIRDYAMESPEEITRELLTQHMRGLIPEDKFQTQILLKIDRQAKWEPILQVMLAIKEAGFEVRPVYEPIGVSD